MRVRNDVRISLLLLLGDIAAINLAFLAAYWLRFNSGLFPVVHGIPHVGHYFRVLPILTVIQLFLMRSEKLYLVRVRLSIVDEIFTLSRVATIGVIVFMAATFLYREYLFSRGMLLVSWFCLVLSLSAWRLLVNRIRFYLRATKGKTRKLLILGDRPIVDRLIRHIMDDPHWDYDVKGVLRMTKEGLKIPVERVPVLGLVEKLPEILEEHKIDEVILTETEISRDVIFDIILECEKKMVEFHLVADILGMVTSQVDMGMIDGIPLLGLKESPLSEGYNRFVKRFMDIVFSSFGIVVLSPFLLIIAVVIKANSPGSVFYLQERVGEDGRHFMMIKFRTMVDNAEKNTGPMWALKDDPRRTGVGSFLRQTNLDELPQLFNVLKGEMSLVGPRPERPNFVVKFREDIPRYMARHKIRSGMTGWAQVNGLRGNTSIEERTKYDLYYIENWSISFDLKILFMSVFAIKNAY